MTRFFRTVLVVLMGCAGGVGMGAGSTYAAEPSVAFHPKTAWKIVKPAAQQCVMQSEFDNGFIVRVSGSNAGQNNVDYISIDFIQSVFSSQKSYPVKISVPGLVSKTIQALAESSKILQVGMRGHRDVMNALESTGAFDLALDANHFRFYMTGISEGIKKFDRCTHGLTTRPALVDTAALHEPSLPEPVYEPFDFKQKTGVVPVKEILPEGMEAYIPDEGLSSPPFAGPVRSAPMPLGSDDRPRSGGREYLDRMRNNEYGETNSSEVVSLDRGAALPVPAPLSPSAALPVLDDVVEVAPARAVPPEAVPAPVMKEPKMPDPLRATYRQEQITAKADFAAHADRAIASQNNEPFSKSYERISTGKKKSSRSMASASPVSSGYGGEGMNEKVSELSRKLAKLEAKNVALEEELKDAYKATEQERLAISSENWDLERATMRFNEAERQIEKLGRQLQRQRIQYEAEKAKLEEMLFDPSLTETSQIAELARLEAENQALKAKLRATGR